MTRTTTEGLWSGRYGLRADPGLEMHVQDRVDPVSALGNGGTVDRCVLQGLTDPGSGELGAGSPEVLPEFVAQGRAVGGHGDSSGDAAVLMGRAGTAVAVGG